MEDMPSWVHVRSGRMDADEMESLIRELSVQTVVDATRPYADLVTENIKAACRRAQVKYSAPAQCRPLLWKKCREP